MDNRGFFEALFDFSFAELITPKNIRFLYGAGMIIAGLIVLGGILAGFRGGPLRGVAALIFSPLLFLIYAVLLRIYLEILIVIFRIAEDVRRLAERPGRLPTE